MTKKGYKQTEEHRRKISEAARRRYQNPANRRKHSKALKKMLSRPENKHLRRKSERTKKRLSNALKKYYKNNSSYWKGRKQPKEYVEKRRQAQLEHYKTNPSKNIGIKPTLKTRRKISESVKKWFRERDRKKK